MSIACFIKYRIDPYRSEDFAEYSRTWGHVIPRCGADLIGYFGPHEGSATTAYGVYLVDSLAAYEDYRVRLAADPEAQANFEMARDKRFILEEDRIFLRLMSTPHGELQR